MDTLRLLRWAASLAVFALAHQGAAGHALAAGPFVSVGDELAVGKNRTGEACRLKLIAVREENGFRRFSLFCDGWTQPSGDLWSFNAGKGFALDKFMTDSVWEKNFSQRVGGCGAVEPTTLGSGTPAALRECRRQDGGWKVLLVGAAVGGHGYGLETFPTNLPLLEAAVEVLEGKRPAVEVAGSKGSISAAIRRAEAMTDASGKLTGVGDVGARALFFRVGTLRNMAGDYPGSETAFRRVLEIEERAGGPNQPVSGRTLAEMALQIGYQGGRGDEAIQLYDRAEPLVQKSLSWVDRPLYLAYRANTERARGRPEIGLPLAEEAVRLRDQREIRQGNEPSGLAHALVSLGRNQLDLKRLDEAERNFSRSLDIVQKPGQDVDFRTWWVGESHGWLGRVYVEQKRYADARKHFEAQLERRRLLFGDSVTAAGAYLELGQLSRKEGNLPAALQSFRKQAEIYGVDPVARNRVRPQFLAPYMDTLFEVAAADPVQREALFAEAFAAAQLPKEGDTARAITNMAARLDTADPALSGVAREYQEAIRARDTARRELALMTLLPADKREPAREAELAKALQAAEAQVASREGRLQAEFPRYAGLVSARPLTLKDLTALLRPGEALVSILATRDATYVFVVRNGKITAHRAAVGYSALDKSVRDLRKGLDLADGQLRDFDVAAAHKMYTDLLAPVSAPLTGATHLIVVPTGPLLSLPLGLLVTKPAPLPQAAATPEKKDYRQVAFLGKQVPISVLPSLGSLKSLRAVAGRSKAAQPFIGFGDPAFGGAPGDTRNLAALAKLCREGGEWTSSSCAVCRGFANRRASSGRSRRRSRRRSRM